MDFAVDNFFGSFRDFVKRVEDDVIQLKRNLDGGYSLGPQQLKERLKDLQQRSTEMETTLSDLESRTMDATTLSELLNHCLIVHSHIISGTEQLRIHLQNYGYVSTVPEKPLRDSHPWMTPIKQSQQKEVASPWRGSISRSQNPLTQLDYSATPRRDATPQKLPIEASLRSSSCSEEVIQCSPATLALKKKYANLQRHSIAPSPSPIPKRPSIENRPSDDFEFKLPSIPPISRQDPTGSRGYPQMKQLMAVDGDAEIAEMDLDRSPVRHPDESGGQWPTSDLHAIAIRDGRRPSLRLSFDSEPLRFGRPFRTSMKTEKNRDSISSPFSKIPLELYDTLPSTLKQSVSLFQLNEAFDGIRRQAKMAEDGYLKAVYMEQLYDKVVLEVLVKLGKLEQGFRSGEMGYRRRS